APSVMEIGLSDGRCTAVASPPARCTAVPANAIVVVEGLRDAGQTHVAIAPPDWLGIRASMRVMFGEVVSVPELYDAGVVDVWAEALLASGARKIVLGGFARGY